MQSSKREHPLHNPIHTRSQPPCDLPSYNPFSSLLWLSCAAAARHHVTSCTRSERLARPYGSAERLNPNRLRARLYSSGLCAALPTQPQARVPERLSTCACPFLSPYWDVTSRVVWHEPQSIGPPSIYFPVANTPLSGGGFPRTTADGWGTLLKPTAQQRLPLGTPGSYQTCGSTDW